MYLCCVFLECAGVVVVDRVILGIHMRCDHCCFVIVDCGCVVGIYCFFAEHCVVVVVVCVVVDVAVGVVVITLVGDVVVVVVV